MNTNIKNFIEKNADLIDSNQFEKLYNSLDSTYRGDLSDVFITARIDFLSYMKKIPEACFYKSKALTKLTIPENIRHIGKSAFMDSSLTSITIPNSVASMDEGVFSDCSNLTNITIPNSVISIGDYAFEDCSSLTNITIPNSVTNIGEGAFQGCSELKTILFNGTIKKWKSIANESSQSQDLRDCKVQCIDGEI